MSSKTGLKQLFFDLVDIGSPSGFEEPMMKKLITLLKPHVHNVYDTLRGNIIGIQEGINPNAPKIALVAHMDQVGFVITNIDEKGFIYFRKLGGAVSRTIQGQQIKILGSKKPIIGVVGLKPGHITKPSEANQIPPINEMYIDIGAESIEEVNSMGVTIGTPMVWNTKPIELANNYVSSPATDDRIGLTVLIKLAETLKKQSTQSTVYYIGTVEEEIGLRGAEVALYDLDVDFAIAIDTCSAGYQPDVVMKDLYYEVGKGPAIHIGELGRRTRIGSRVIRDWLISIAKENGIPYQSGFLHGGTDTSAIQQTKSGIPSCSIAVPRRYSHSPVEVFNINDLSNLIKILEEAIINLDENFTLHRI